MEFFVKQKGVPPTYVDCVCSGYFFQWTTGFVQAFEFLTSSSEKLLHPGRVARVILRCKGDENHIIAFVEVLSDKATI